MNWILTYSQLLIVWRPSFKTLLRASVPCYPVARLQNCCLIDIPHISDTNFTQCQSDISVPFSKWHFSHFVSVTSLRQAQAGSRDPGILRQPKSRDFWNWNPGIFRDYLLLCSGPLGSSKLERSFAKNCQNCQRSFSTFCNGKSRPEKSRDPGIWQNPVPENPWIENLDPARACSRDSRF